MRGAGEGWVGGAGRAVGVCSVRVEGRKRVRRRKGPVYGKGEGEEFCRFRTSNKSRVEFTVEDSLWKGTGRSFLL